MRMDWSLIQKHGDVHRFLKLLVQRRLLRDMGPERERKTLHELIHSAVKCWHGVRLNQPDWSDNSRSVALSVELQNEGISFYLALNAYWESLTFELPVIDFVSRGPWRRWIDTNLETPHDIVDWQSAPPVSGDLYHVGPRSTVILLAGGIESRTSKCAETSARQSPPIP